MDRGYLRRGGGTRGEAGQHDRGRTGAPAPHVLLAVATLVALGGCLITEKSRRGAVLDEAAVAGLRDGSTTRAAALRALGPPVVVARRAGTVRVPILDEPRLGDAERPGERFFEPFVGLSPEPEEVVYWYRAMLVYEAYTYDLHNACYLCLPTTVTESRGRETTFEELYLLLDDRTGLLRAHVHLRNGQVHDRQPAASMPEAGTEWGRP